jgi:uncharacterized protein YegP (UPF0339 family)
MPKVLWSVALGVVLALVVTCPVVPGSALAEPGTLPAAQAGKDKEHLKFEMYEDAAQEYRWRLKTADGKNLATAGQGYKSKESCKNGIELVKTEANSDKLKFEEYEDKGMEHRWRLKAANGQIVAASSEGYKTKADCEKAIEMIKKGASKAEVEEKK